MTVISPYTHGTQTTLHLMILSKITIGSNSPFTQHVNKEKVNLLILHM